MRKKCSSDPEKPMTVEAEITRTISLSSEFFDDRMLFWLLPGDLSYLIN